MNQKIIIVVLILIAFTTQAFGIEIDQGSIDWDFDITEDNKSEVHVEIKKINNTIVELTLDAINESTLANNYKWHMAICNVSGIDELDFLNEDAQGGFDNAIGQSALYGKLENFGLPTEWCEEQNNEGYILFSSSSKNQLPKKIRLILPDPKLNQEASFKIYAGTQSTVVDASAAASGTFGSFLNNFCISTEDTYHIANRGSADTVRYSSSIDMGASWSTTVNVGTDTTAVTVGIVCMNNGSIFITYINATAAEDAVIIQSTDDGASWGDPTVLLDNSEGQSEFNCDGDSNSVLHCVSKPNADVWYFNSSDPSAAAEISSADSDNVKLGVDFADNVYILITDSSGDDLDIMSSQDGWSTRNEWDGGGGQIDASDSHPAIGFCDNGTIYAAYTVQNNLEFCTGKSATWESSDGCAQVDSDNSFDASMAASNICNPYIGYGTVATENPQVLANRTGGDAFQIRTQIEASAADLSLGSSVFPMNNRIGDGINTKLHYVATDSSTVIYRNVSVRVGNVTPFVSATDLYDNDTFEEKTAFLRGENILINVTMIDQNDDIVWVNVSILDPDGTTQLKNASMNADSTGLLYNFSFDVPSDATLGDWTVQIYSQDTYFRNYTAESAATFEVIKFGDLLVNLSTPPNSTVFATLDEFHMNATVTCNGEAGVICGIVEALARYNASGASTPNSNITTTKGSGPLYITGGGGSQSFRSIEEKGDSQSEDESDITHCSDSSTFRFASLGFTSEVEATLKNVTINFSLIQSTYTYNVTICKFSTDVCDFSDCTTLIDVADEITGSTGYQTIPIDTSVDFVLEEGQNYTILFSTESCSGFGIGARAGFDTSVSDMLSEWVVSGSCDAGRIAGLADIIINYSSSENPLESSEKLEKGESFNVSFTINITGADNYNIDVKFNSSTHSEEQVLPNATGFHRICVGECEPAPGEEDTCSPTTPLIENHVFDAADNCGINSPFNSGGFDVACLDIGNGQGTLSVNAPVTNYGIFYTGNGCTKICNGIQC